MFPGLISLQFNFSLAVPAGSELTMMPTTPFSRMQTLEMDLPKLPQVYVKHFTCHLPDSLANLEINLTGTHFHE